MTAHLTGRLVHAAHADAWQEHGRLRRAQGGDLGDLPGVRLMSSGLPHAPWNTADVLDARRVDVDAVRDWYGARAVPWGVRVPAGTAWPYGRHLVRQRLMGQVPADLRPAAAPAGVTLRTAAPPDLEAVVAVDAAAFGSEPAPTRRWLAPLLAGVAVVQRARRRGVASAMSSALLQKAYDAGACLGHLQPDTAAAAAVYARLGFVEGRGVDVHAGTDDTDR